MCVFRAAPLCHCESRFAGSCVSLRLWFFLMKPLSLSSEKQCFHNAKNLKMLTLNWQVLRTSRKWWFLPEKDECHLKHKHVGAVFPHVVFISNALRCFRATAALLCTYCIGFSQLRRFLLGFNYFWRGCSVFSLWSWQRKKKIGQQKSLQ